jgi:hypothetical protein
MRYRIEFLTESTDERSVSSSVSHAGPLADVVTMANGEAKSLKPDGYQIRDLDHVDAQIVWLEHCRI